MKCHVRGNTTRDDWSGWYDAETPDEALKQFLAGSAALKDTTGHGITYTVSILPEQKLKVLFGDEWRQPTSSEGDA